MDASSVWKTGRRRNIEPVEARHFQWSLNRDDRGAMVMTWQTIAFAILRRERVNRCLVPVLADAVYWIGGEQPDGIIKSGNASLAKKANCAPATAKRLIEHYSNLGILTRKTNLVREKDGRVHSCRVMRLSLPLTGLPDETVPEDDDPLE